MSFLEQPAHETVGPARGLGQRPDGGTLLVLGFEVGYQLGTRLSADPGGFHRFRHQLPPSASRTGCRRADHDPLIIFASGDTEENDSVAGFELPAADLSGEELTVRVGPQQADAFTCSVCLLVYHRNRYAGDRAGLSICRDCAR